MCAEDAPQVAIRGNGSVVRLRHASSRTARDKDRGIGHPPMFSGYGEEQRKAQADPSPPFANNATGFGMTPRPPASSTGENW
jgi:hypothetical protein